jgi:hypothetical protein
VSEGHYRYPHYQIRVRGYLDREWAAWFDGLAITHAEDGDTVLDGPVADQAALHGLLAKIRDLGLSLVSVNLQGECSPDSENEEADGTFPADCPDAWLVYTNAEYGFTFSDPPEWMLVKVSRIEE